MIDHLLKNIAPHPCYGCAKLGQILCDNCKYDIVSEPFLACVACGKGIRGRHGVCGSCNVSYEQAWCVSSRKDSVQLLIDDFKFNNARASYIPLADLLHMHLPILPENTHVVPIPTVRSHVRQRGYDHSVLVAKRFAKLRKLPLNTSLERITTTMQRGAKAKQRKDQAKQAFACYRQLDADAVYLIIDDVVTTGATMQYAAETLIKAGASKVWIATVSRQPLD